MIRASHRDDKIDATAAVVSEIVKQRQMMHTQMMQMQEQMMGHMAEHMQMGDMKAMQQSMQTCPMMKGTMAPKPQKQRRERRAMRGLLVALTWFFPSQRQRSPSSRPPPIGDQVFIV